MQGCCFPVSTFRSQGSGSENFPLHGAYSPPPCREFMCTFWTNIRNSQKLSLSVGTIALTIGAFGLAGTLGMPSLLAAGLTTAGAVMISKGLFDAMPNYCCGDDQNLEESYVVMDDQRERIADVSGTRDTIERSYNHTGHTDHTERTDRSYRTVPPQSDRPTVVTSNPLDSKYYTRVVPDSAYSDGSESR